jgi:hypothetical protein
LPSLHFKHPQYRTQALWPCLLLVLRKRSHLQPLTKMPQLWQIIWFRRFYEHRPDLNKQTDYGQRRTRRLLPVTTTSISALHSVLMPRAPLTEVISGTLILSVGLRRSILAYGAPNAARSSRRPPPNTATSRSSTQYVLHSVSQCLWMADRGWIGRGGEKALELRMPHRACCNLYDIIHCHAPKEREGAMAVVAVPHESQDH